MTSVSLPLSTDAVPPSQKATTCYEHILYVLQEFDVWYHGCWYSFRNPHRNDQDRCDYCLCLFLSRQQRAKNKLRSRRLINLNIQLLESPLLNPKVWNLWWYKNETIQMFIFKYIHSKWYFSTLSIHLLNRHSYSYP